jgi:pSer/pThr/pTyr-binding forkhead associated (FHA) protein
MAPDQFRPGTLWVEGRIGLRLDDGSLREIDRPFVRIGGTGCADLRLAGHGTHAHHVYLHLDRRGLFALGLTGRDGLRIDGKAMPAGWLRAGQTMMVAGRKIEIVALRVDGASLPVEGSEPSPLPTENASTQLVQVELHPIPAAECPWTLNSELVVLGRSPSCGVSIPSMTVARVHAVLVRGNSAAYVVNLAGAGLGRNGRLVREAAVLTDGDQLTIGSARFDVRLQPPSRPVPAKRSLATTEPSASWPVALLPPPPAELVPAEAQSALLAWMMGTIQAIQAEMLHRQDTFQRELAQALRALHEDHEDALAAHQARVESIHQELAALRDDLRHQLDPARPPAETPPFPPLQLAAPAVPPADPAAATAWLLDRVQHLDAANRASWRDLLGRLHPRPGS